MKSTLQSFLPILFLLLSWAASAQSLTPDAAKAEVHVVVYSSYACPYCAAWSKSLESLITAHDGRVSVQMRHFALDATRERWAIAAAEALANQGLFRELHGSLFEKVAGKVDTNAWRKSAALKGVDLERLDRDIAEQMARSIDTGELARAHGVQVTPTTFVDGIRFDGLPSLESIDTVIRGRLERVETASQSITSQKTREMRR